MCWPRSLFGLWGPFGPSLSVSMSTYNLLTVLKAILQYLTAFLQSFHSVFVVQVNIFVVNVCWPEGSSLSVFMSACNLLMVLEAILQYLMGIGKWFCGQMCILLKYIWYREIPWTIHKGFYAKQLVLQSRSVNL
jgi:hypothetical protein